MKEQKAILILFLTFLTFFSCGQINHNEKDFAINIPKNLDSLKQILNHNIKYIGDSLLTQKEFLIKAYIAKYHNDSCGFVVYQNSDLKKGFEGVKNVGDLNGDQKADTVFVIPPFDHCNDGCSYTFFDTILPRLNTDSYCCHPDNLFSIGDIDEDGLSEICIFYSSCVSRFKALLAYSLKNNEWREIGNCTFDINFMEPNKEKRVRKVGKGKFEMLEVVDKVENQKWKQFSF